jgi:hypothetical protein
VRGIEIGIRKEKHKIVDAIPIPKGMIQGERDQKTEIRIRAGAMMIIMRGEGIKKRSGERGIATHGRAHQIGGGTGIDAMRDETRKQMSRLHWGIISNVY